MRFFTDWRLLLFNLAMVAISPLLLLSKIARYLIHRRAREFDFNRWTCPIRPGREAGKTQGPHVVFVGTGFGETRIVEQLSQALCKAHPHVRTTWALRDGEAVRAARERHPDQAVTWMPFDFALPVWSWLRRLSPDVVVFVEKFWFHNLARCSARWGAKVMLANGRMRAHTASRYGLMRPFHRWVVGSFRCLCFQSEEQRSRIRAILPATVETRVTGNVKFDLRPPRAPADADGLTQWLAASRDTPLLAAGSTGPADEEWVLKAFEIVRCEMPCALLLAPRRLHRVDEVCEAVAARELRLSRRTQPAHGPSAVYLLDTMGELATAYKFAAAAFIGGTVAADDSGHNVLEPLLWGVPVCYGPAKSDFATVQRACEAAGVGSIVGSPEELAAHWLFVLQNPQRRDEWRTRAAQLLAQQCGAVEKTIAAIFEQLQNIGPIEQAERLADSSPSPSSSAAAHNSKRETL